MKTLWTLLFLAFLISGQGQNPTVGLISNTNSSADSYTLFAPLNSKTTYLIDKCGLVVNSWQSDFVPGNAAYFLEDGTLLRAAKVVPNNFVGGGGLGGRLEQFDWDGNLIWAFNFNTEMYSQHHDMAVLPNGNILFLVWDRKNEAEVIEAGRAPNTVVNEELWFEKIFEIKPIGTDSAQIVWEWHLWDHLIQDFDDSKQNFGVVADHPELLDLNYFGDPGLANPSVDWVHFNSIDYNESLDQIILSSRYLDEIYIIDHSTTTAEAASHVGGNSGKGGDFLFRWGNPQAYRKGTVDDKKFFGQHNAYWIPDNIPGGGKIMVFNNGLWRNFSSVDIIQPVLDTSGNYLLENTSGTFLPTQLDWSYVADPPDDFYSNFISGAQRLSNGNTLICAGAKGKIFEVEATTNEVIWEYINPVNQFGPVEQGTNIQFPAHTIFKALRYEQDYPGFLGKDLTPGDPIELNPLPPVGLCASLKVNYLSNLEIKVFPNPTKEKVNIEFFENKIHHIQIINQFGNVLLLKIEFGKKIELDVRFLPPGLYYLLVDNHSAQRLTILK